MSLIVQKFGGTSVGSVERIKNVARRVAKWSAAGHQVVVVPSAMSGETNRLIALAKEIQASPDPRELDVVASTGEQVTVGLLAMALTELGVKAKSYTGAQVRVLTDSSFTKARIQAIDEKRLRADLAAGVVPVVAGFQGVDPDGNITTLGRGGSDTSAVALAAALSADECFIFTDVDGVYTTDPRIVPEARRLPTITFEEMLEMASLGSKVLQIRSVEFAGKYKVRLRVLSSLTDPRVVPEARKLDTITFEEMLEMASLGSKVLQIRSVEFAGKYKVKLRVLSSFQEEGEGTLITVEEDKNMEQPIISGIAFNRDEAKITVLGVPDKPGIAYQILGPVAEANVDVDMIIQNVGHDGTTDFSFTVNRPDYDKTLGILESVKTHTGAREIRGDRTMAKVSIVGVGMRSHPGVASRMFRTLAEEGINIQMISTSEIKISIVIDEKYVELAVRVLHKAFELDQGA